MHSVDIPILFLLLTLSTVVMLVWTFASLVFFCKSAFDVAILKKNKEMFLFLIPCSLIFLTLSCCNMCISFHILTDEQLMDICTNLNSTWKLFTIKSSVGLIVVQGILFDFLMLAGAMDLKEEEGLSEGDQVTQFLCCLILIEYSVMSLLVYCIYSTEIVSLKDAPDSSNFQKSSMTFVEFRRKVFSIGDTFDNLKLTPSDLSDPIFGSA